MIYSIYNSFFFCNEQEDLCVRRRANQFLLSKITLQYALNLSKVGYAKHIEMHQEIVQLVNLTTFISTRC